MSTSRPPLSRPKWTLGASPSVLLFSYHSHRPLRFVLLSPILVNRPSLLFNNILSGTSQSPLSRPIWILGAPPPSLLFNNIIFIHTVHLDYKIFPSERVHLDYKISISPSRDRIHLDSKISNYTNYYYTVHQDESIWTIKYQSTRIHQVDAPILSSMKLTTSSSRFDPSNRTAQKVESAKLKSNLQSIRTSPSGELPRS